MSEIIKKVSINEVAFFLFYFYQWIVRKINCEDTVDAIPETVKSKLLSSLHEIGYDAYSI